MTYHNLLFKHADAFCKDFECPASFTYLALLEATSIINQGRNYMYLGNEKIPLNLFIILCGNPNLKAHQAVNFTRFILEGLNYNNYLPDNLGQRKVLGLQLAMLSNSSTDGIDDPLAMLDNDVIPFVSSKSSKNARDIDSFFGSTGKQAKGDGLTIRYDSNSDSDSVHSKAYVGDDFVAFAYTNQHDFFSYLQAMWKCKNYKLSAGHGPITLNNPYLNIFSCMTQVGLMDCFPDNYIGICSLAHFLIALEERPKNKNPYPSKSPMNVYMDILKQLEWVQESAEELVITAEAKLLGATYYKDQHQTLDDDSRLQQYSELRHIHMHRIAANLALYENRIRITEHDIEDANSLLERIESKLSDALGEFGNSKIATGRQKCIDLLRREEVMKKSLYRARCASFLYSKDFEIFLTDMIVQKKILETWSPEHNDYVLAYNPNYRQKSRQVVVLDETLEELNNGTDKP